MISKSWAIKLATEAARTVLSVDQIIVARQAGGPKPPGPNPVRQFSSFSAQFVADMT
jgi:T-complex protein 1 subunit theta